MDENNLTNMLPFINCGMLKMLIHTYSGTQNNLILDSSSKRASDIHQVAKHH